MTTAHKKHGNDDKGHEHHAGGSSAKKEKDSRVIILTCTLNDNVDDESADKLRQEMSTYLESYLRKRVDKQLKDLVVH